MRRQRPAWSLGWLAAAVLACSSSLTLADQAFAEDPMPAAPAEPPKPEEPAKPGEPAKPDPAQPDPAKPVPAQPAPAPTPAKPEPVRLKDALAELERLKSYLRDKKADPEDIKGSLEGISKAYHNLAADLVAGPDGALVEDVAPFDKARDTFRGQVEDLLVRALVLTLVKPNTETNLRDDVNVKAAQVIGTLATADPKAAGRMAPRVKDALERNILEAKNYKPATAVYDEAFKALGLLNDHKHGLTYVQEWIKYGNTGPDADAIKAAHEALSLFKKVPGARRRELVELMIRTFAPVETAADTNKDAKQRAQKAVWDKVKPAVIKALQDIAGQPKDEKGAVLATVKEFQNWFRDHENVRKDPWVDQKVKE